MLNKIYFEDCIETMKRIPDGSIDLMLTDPPYNITACKWDVKIDLDILWKEWLRIVKNNGALIFTASQPFTTDLINSQRDIFKYELIWDKVFPTGFLNANKMFMRSHENIIIFYRQQPVYNSQKTKGNKNHSKKTKTDRTNCYGKFNQVDNSEQLGYMKHPTSILIFHKGHPSKSLHATEKPVDLFRYLIKTYSNEGDTVFDGYMGSGTTAIACIMEKRNFIGSEMNEKYFKAAEKRIKISQMQQKLF